MVQKITNQMRATFLENFKQQQNTKRQLLKEIVKEGEMHETEMAEHSLFSEADIPMQNGLESMTASEKYVLSSNDFTGVSAESYDPDVMSNLLSSYMSSAEIDTMFEYVEDSEVSKGDLDDLTEKLSASEDEAAAAIISEFFEGGMLSTVAVFAALTYLYEELSKKEKKKNKTLALLKRLLEKFSQQNSAFLSEMFQIQKHPLVKQSTKLSIGLANLSAGNISIDSLKSAIQFVDDYLDADFDKIVSKCIRLRINVLSRLTTKRLSFEAKTELSGYLKCEKNLIVINSIYNNFDKFKNSVEQDILIDGKLSTDNVKSLNSIIEFAENILINNFILKNFMNNIGFDKKFEVDLRLRTKIVELFQHLPMVLFNEDNKKRQKLIEAMRTFKIRSDPESGNSFSFIKKRKTNVKLV